MVFHMLVSFALQLNNNKLNLSSYKYNKNCSLDRFHNSKTKHLTIDTNLTVKLVQEVKGFSNEGVNKIPGLLLWVIIVKKERYNKN